MITKSTLDILRDMADEQPRQRQRHSDQEHRLQCACVQWFRTQHPKFNHNLFAVPNGGRRDKVTGAKLKAEGVLAGVADLILLKSNADYGALLIEMKTGSGKQSEVQGRWQKAIEKDGYKYVLCRSLEDFMREINAYLKEVQG
jgi:VRR-NUC domain protein